MTITSDPRASGGEPTAESDVSPWDEWLAESTTIAEAQPSGDGWLDRLLTQLPVHAIACRDEEAHLAVVWQHMLPALSAFRPAEVDDVISARIAAAARRGAAEALLDMARTERARLQAETEVELETEFSGARALRRLLEGVAAERAEMSRIASAKLLEVLCDVALDLEITERSARDAGPEVHQALTEMRTHIIEAANTLRSLPESYEVAADTDESVVSVLTACIARYADTLDAELRWDGAEPVSAETAMALIWVVEELLHHLHTVRAGAALFEVAVDSEVHLVVTTPSAAFDLDDVEPQWLLRCQLRLQLADGDITVLTGGDGTGIEASLPS